MKYNFTKEDLAKASEYAANIDVNYYSGRDQLDVQKKRLDQKVGKLGEIAAYNCLKDTLPGLSYPDFEIYAAKDKSWDFDMKNANVNLHVKSQLNIQAVEYGESWIFQNQDKHIFKDYAPIDYVAFVIVSLIHKSAEVKAVISLHNLHQKQLFKMPVKENLRKSNKLAVYFEDLAEHPDQLWQL
jgi:hypothetical protein